MIYDYRADPMLGKALAYWQSKRRGRSVPARSDIDPVEIPALLPNIQLIEVVSDGSFRYRLVGTALVDAFGRDYTGGYVGKLIDTRRAETLIEHHQRVCAERKPVFARSRYLTTKDIDLVANRLYLPLSEDGLDVNMILGTLTLEFGALAPIRGEWRAARLTGTEAELVITD